MCQGASAVGVSDEVGRGVKCQGWTKIQVLM